MTDRCGTHLGYRDHERNGTDKCDPCLDGQAAWQRDYEKRRYLAGGNMLIDGTGTRRRLRALAALGWPRRVLAERLNTRLSYAGALMYKNRVHWDTAARVAAVYDELSMTIGPSPRAASDAKAKGWPVPLDWDEEDIDNPDAAPVHAPNPSNGGGPLRDIEREEKVMELTRAGVSVGNIVARLGVGERYVNRVRARYRDEGQVAS
jgi:hypothetical protein